MIITFGEGFAINVIVLSRKDNLNLDLCSNTLII